MLMCWISVVNNIHKTTKEVCNPDVNEMTRFKKNLLEKIGEKEKKS